MNTHEITRDFNGKTLTLSTGLLANQATASVTGRLGDTMVLATVVMSERDTTLDYFPLQVEYAERLSAGGKIKGSRWVKREGRPSDEAVLTGRLIDRSIRPLFPHELKKDIQIIVTLLSVDQENDPDILSMVTVSAALAMSKIPWNGPLGASRIGLVGEEGGKKELIVNPSMTQYEFSDLDLVVSSTKDRVVMIEAGAKQVDEEVIKEAIQLAKGANDEVIALIEDFVKEVGQEKIVLPKDEKAEEAMMIVEKSWKDKIEALTKEKVTKDTEKQLRALTDEIIEANKDIFDDSGKLAHAAHEVFKKVLRKNTLGGTRPDGRKEDELRQISAQVGLIPRTHGSAIFQRGDTQALTIATLGSASLAQLIETPDSEYEKFYMHHYSMPPFSVGETGRLGSPSRREIGHGALAERALEPVIPSQSTFPYAIRVVSEIMSSNGSTSMASTCGSTLALMDAGVPISDPVGGISIGLVEEGDKYVLLTDIAGLEDHTGDMDFKVAGTKNGVTAIQLDVKNTGLTEEMITGTFTRAKAARTKILEIMLGALPESRQAVSTYAPKIKTIQIDPTKIGEVIGTGGKTIRHISESTGTTVDVTDEGVVSVAAVDADAVQKAADWIYNMTRELQVGEVFTGTVKRLMPFGAFVEVVPGKEGLVHVSEMSPEYVAKPEDVVAIGQEVKVRVKEIDDMGRLNLSMLFGDFEKKKPEGGEGSRPSGGKGGYNRGGSGGYNKDRNRGPRRDNSGSRQSGGRGPRR